MAAGDADQRVWTATVVVPTLPLSSGKPMPRATFATATATFATAEGHTGVKEAVLCAIGAGYRHFDTAAVYNTEAPLGDAVAEAVRAGTIASRDEVYVTSKLWITDAHPGRVLPALEKTLRNLRMEYVDLYLIHHPVSQRAPKDDGNMVLVKEDLVEMDMKGVWEEMEECHRRGLAKAIGVSNFACKKLERLLSFATIPPAVNQVEVNPYCRQKKLREFCRARGIQLCGYSPLGANGATAWANSSVMESPVLKQIAQDRCKSVAQLSPWLPMTQANEGGLPTVPLSSGKPMPRLGFGTATATLGHAEGHAGVKEAVLCAIGAGYRHFDTAAVYNTEAALGDAVAEAVRTGMIASREEVYITSKLWITDAYPGRMEYVDMYLIHHPVSMRLPEAEGGPVVVKKDLVAMDVKGVWEELEECHRRGLARAIGVSNFACKKLENLLSFARIPPAAVQAEVHPYCRQKKLREFCRARGIQLCGYSPLGASGTVWANNSVMESPVLKQIAQDRGKTVAQVNFGCDYYLFD
ncbi:hypothetical protein HU200_042112 [Digitaria exilis]|uniref:NADP-dependent oxidoreductase domain-containing protein n=1 Tax=Digitaria exilis TaxID=1010633 RepID=A0A835EHI3_9POAL|nr:hypothetical protein HU200_042112 [Digitaria exilis]